MFMTFMSLSSGPLTWRAGPADADRLGAAVPLLLAKWYVLVVFGGDRARHLQLAYPGGLDRLRHRHLRLQPADRLGPAPRSSSTAAPAVLRHPLFGIGLSADWGAPWWRPASVDNYWLVTAMRYGLPALVFMWLGIALARGADHRPRRGLTEEAASYRKGYLIALAGLFLRARHRAHLGRGQRSSSCSTSAPAPGSTPATPRPSRRAARAAPPPPPAAHRPGTPRRRPAGTAATPAAGLPADRARGAAAPRNAETEVWLERMIDRPSGC